MLSQTDIAVVLSNTVSKLREVKSVNQWNTVREGAKRTLKDLVFKGNTGTLQELNALFTQAWLTHFVPTIDGSGLIVEVLGMDPIKDKKQK